MQGLVIESVSYGSNDNRWRLGDGRVNDCYPCPCFKEAARATTVNTQMFLQHPLAYWALDAIFLKSVSIPRH